VHGGGHAELLGFARGPAGGQCEDFSEETGAANVGAGFLVAPAGGGDEAMNRFFVSEAERLILERHPQIGYRMLESLGVQPVAEWVLHHHERWDGAGYPSRLSADQIPLGARIIFVADAYDAMTSDRAYRQAIPARDALAELERCAGTQFDPAVVAALTEELLPVDDEAVAV
jgi:hypothetical protein